MSGAGILISSSGTSALLMPIGSVHLLRVAFAEEGAKGKTHYIAS